MSVRARTLHGPTGQAQTRAQFRKEADEARVKALQRLALADQAPRKEREREALRHLRASVSGTVQDLSVHNPCGRAWWRRPIS